MAYKAAEDLLELINLYLEGKTLYLAKREESAFSIVKALDNVKEINIKEGDTRKMEDAY